MKYLKILHLEDNAMKQTAIARVLHDVCEAEIDWVTDVASGMKKIEEIKEQGICMIWQSQTCSIR
ncbi:MULTISPECIES: hypothetical protein [Clostridia]|uniref:hypothetical protein n=1 Tax=Clostridia TaxID=186801 RepID=UPI000E47D19B|nr:MULTISPECIES: hypothetical protein [Clostridia]RHV71615.1 hypothetical protein DXB15_03065 [Roseburia sp. OM02-15]